MAEGLHRIGAVSNGTMRDFDQLCQPGTESPNTLQAANWTQGTSATGLTDHQHLGIRPEHCQNNLMSSRSKIEWTEHTWNPVTGCTKLSPGCKFCYAEVLAKRLQRMGAKGYDNAFALTLQPDRLRDPIKRQKPTVWFVNSMSDLFHEKVPFDFVDRVLETIRETPQHRYQILTKRPARMAEYFEDRKVPANTWLGTSVENRKHGVPRIAVLRGIKGRVRFLSIEPLLEDLGPLDLRRISWVIVGGESGAKARPMKVEWALSIRNQCEEAEVPFFFKQWGSHGPDGVRRAKKTNGRVLEGRTHDQMPG